MALHETAPTRFDFGGADHWTKGKRSKRSRCETLPLPPPTAEDAFLAACLLMLARGGEPSVRIDASAEETLSVPPPPREEPPVPTPIHECSVCSRAFSSYQALGGHKASHHGKSAPAETAAADIPTTSSSYAGSTANSMSGRTKHKCSICHQTFSTGQALGGHMRCHYKGVIGSKHNIGGGSCAGLTPSWDCAGASTGQIRAEFQNQIVSGCGGFDLGLNLPSAAGKLLSCGGEILGGEESSPVPPRRKKPRLVFRLEKKKLIDGCPWKMIKI